MTKAKEGLFAMLGMTLTSLDEHTRSPLTAYRSRFESFPSFFFKKASCASTASLSF